MSHVLTIALCLAASGLLVGYLGQAGELDLLTWQAQKIIGLKVFWTGLLALALSMFFIRK